MTAALQENSQQQQQQGAPPGEPTFGRVLLNISNSVLPLEKLSPTPSSLDSMSQEVETDLRNLGCNLIQTAGKLLKLPQVAMATACVMFQRFFYSKSFVRYNMEQVAIGCVCLASKIEECPRRPRDVINVFHHVKQVRQGKPLKPMILDAEYIALKNNIIKAERRVLKELGFCVHIKHPHKLVVMYLQMLSYETNHKFVQMSWNFMNDSLRTDCFVRYQPETIACACIYLSARKLNIPLPKKPAWYRLLDVEEDDVRDCCYRIICLYQRKKVNQEDLEKIVDQLKQAQDELKKAAKGQASLAQLATSSPASHPSSPHRQERSDQKEESRRERSNSRSQDRKKRKKHKKDRSPSPGSDRDSKQRGRKGERGRRSWSHSPIHKSRKHRSRSRDRLSSSSKHRGLDRPSDKHSDRSKSDKHEHKLYAEKYKKGERIDRDFYRR